MDDRIWAKITAAIIVWIVGTFAAFRVAIPILVNSHNDVALVISFAIAVFWLYATYLAYVFIEGIFNEKA